MNFFETLLTYVGIKAIDKLITDNLPDMKLRRLKELAYLMGFLSAILYFTVVFKITKNIGAKETLFGLNVILIVSLALPSILAKKQANISN